MDIMLSVVVRVGRAVCDELGRVVLSWDALERAFGGGPSP